MMKVLYLTPCILLLGCLCSLVVVSAQDDLSSDEFQSRLHGLFQATFDAQNEATATWIGLHDPLWDQDFYFAFGNSSGGTPPTIAASTEDHFEIGSITTTFAATVMMMLAEKSEWSLNNTVASLIPEFAAKFPEYANYTLEELMRMQTMVPDFEDDVDVLLDGDPTVRFNSVVPMIAAAMERYPIPEFPAYSSTNYMVLDVIVQSLFNSTMQELVDKLILAPLGLNNTIFPPLNGNGNRPEPSSVPYAGSSCVKEMHERYGFPNVTLGSDIDTISKAIVMASSSGSMVSNLQDLLAWAKTGTGDSLLSQAMVSRRHDYNTPLVSGALLYGIGQYIHNQTFLDLIGVREVYGDLEGWYGHTGGTFGYSSKAFRWEQAAYVSAINTCGAHVDEAFFKIYTNDLKARLALPATEQPSEASTPNSSDSNSTMSAPEEEVAVEQPTETISELSSTDFSNMSGIVVTSAPQQEVSQGQPTETTPNSSGAPEQFFHWILICFASSALLGRVWMH